MIEIFLTLVFMIFFIICYLISSLHTGLWTPNVSFLLGDGLHTGGADAGITLLTPTTSLGLYLNISV